MSVPVYLSGPHAAGKTHFIESLPVDQFERLPRLPVENRIHDRPFDRCLLKLTQYSLEYRWHGEIVTWSGRPTWSVGDRCVWDVQAYAQAFYESGYFSSSDYTLLEQYRRQLHETFRAPTRIIILLPGLDVLHRRIKKRRDDGGYVDPNRVRDGEYLATLRRAYIDLHGSLATREGFSVALAENAVDAREALTMFTGG